MKMNLLIIGFLVLVVLVSGCTQPAQQPPEDNTDDGPTQDNGDEISPEQIPTPETPSGENEEPPSLPI